MTHLSHIALPKVGTSQRPIMSLTETHGVNRRAQMMYERFYGLQEVMQHDQCLDGMLSAALRDVLVHLDDAHMDSGHLVYCKTQTHNTISSENWLRGFADNHGLHNWEVSALSMTSCASALVQMHMAQIMSKPDEPLIILTGEKTFHPWVSRLPVGLLAEIPAAALFNVDHTSWNIAGTTIRHLPRFHENPDVMSADDRRALQESYATGLIAFIADSLAQFEPDLRKDMVFLPHNLNQPVTRMILDHFGWGDRCFHGDVAHVGHGFCSDIFLNLAAFEADDCSASQVLVLAAGTGVTFATCLLDRTPHQSILEGY
ncbi:MAG: hypothetical protein ABJO27_27705 [Pseudoruegeria sp.]